MKLDPELIESKRKFMGFPDMRSIADIEKAIKSIEQMNMEYAKISELLTPLKITTRGWCNISVKYLPGKLGLWRGVCLNNKPSYISQISYPPKPSEKLQRANRIGQRMFYAAKLREVPFFELDVLPGEIVTLGYWENHSTVRIGIVGYSEDVFK